MGEVKSAIELALERTRHLVPSRQEREAMAERECGERASVLVRRALEGDLDAPALKREIEGLEASQPAFPWRRTACRGLALALSPGENDKAALPCLAALECPGAPRLQELAEDLLRREEALRADLTARLREEWSSGGLSGSAIVPNPEADPRWEESRRLLRQDFLRARNAATL